MHIPRVVRSNRPPAGKPASSASQPPAQPEGDEEAQRAVSDDVIPEDDRELREPIPQRVVVIRPRSVLMVLLVLVGVAAVVSFFFLASWGLTLIAIALFLALALNPAVRFFQGRGLKRPWAVVAVYIIALAVLALLVLVFIPPLVSQLTSLVNAAPDFVAKLRQGTGPAGVLERRYQVVERVQEAASDLDLTRWSGAAASGFTVIRRIATSLVGAILIAFLTLFMLLEGADWRRRLTSLLPPSNGGSHSADRLRHPQGGRRVRHRQPARQSLGRHRGHGPAVGHRSAVRAAAGRLRGRVGTGALSGTRRGDRRADPVRAHPGRGPGPGRLRSAGRVPLDRGAHPASPDLRSGAQVVARSP